MNLREALALYQQTASVDVSEMTNGQYFDHYNYMSKLREYCLYLGASQAEVHAVYQAGKALRIR